MRMLNGDFNVYWQHDTLVPTNVRAACYGSRNNSGGLVPEVGDVIRDFHGLLGMPITARVIRVDQIGNGCVAFMVTVTSDPPEQPGGAWDDAVMAAALAEDKDDLDE